jgi:O-antigen/teichoic acid export membrane protein
LIGINNALIPQYGKATKRADEFNLLRRMNTYYVLAILVIGLFISLLGKDVLTTLFPSDYHSAVAYIPWVVLGYLSVGLYFIPTNFLTVGLGKSRGIAVASITAALLNICLNLFLVPRLGAIAAAVNTAIAFSLLAIFVYLLARQQGELPVERSRIGKLLITFIFIFLLGLSILDFTPITNLLLFVALLISSLILLSVLKFWTSEEKDWFRRKIASLRW